MDQPRLSFSVIKSELIQAVMRKRRWDPLLVIDIAVPRDIDPAVNDIAGSRLRPLY